MKCNKFIALASSVALNTVIMTGLAMPAAQAAEESLELIWSDTSKAVNRSTEALAAGTLNRAADLAEAALREELRYGDRAIAVHNLCIALAGRAPERAAPHCREAIETAGRMVVKPVGDDLKVRGGRAAFVPSLKAQSLSSLVSANMRRIRGDEAPQLAGTKTGP